jgi:hypothetical protein
MNAANIEHKKAHEEQDDNGDGSDQENVVEN